MDKEELKKFMKVMKISSGVPEYISELISKGEYINGGWHVYEPITNNNLQEITVEPDYIRLETYYPLDKRYPIGHSTIDMITDNSYGHKGEITMPDMHHKNLFGDYNLINNNCAHTTLNALNYIFGTNYSPKSFTTTPGDVVDYATKYFHARKADVNNAGTTHIMYVTPEQRKRYEQYLKLLYNKKNGESYSFINRKPN